jgi:hypothetical protein
MSARMKPSPTKRKFPNKSVLFKAKHLKQKTIALCCGIIYHIAKSSWSQSRYAVQSLAAIEAAKQSACDGYLGIGLPDIDGYELAQIAVRLTVLREAVHARCRYLQTREKSFPARAQRARPATSFSSQVSEGRLIP